METAPCDENGFPDAGAQAQVIARPQAGSSMEPKARKTSETCPRGSRLFVIRFENSQDLEM
jgi:hypothetical protein